MVHGGGVISYMGCSGVYSPKMYRFLTFWSEIGIVFAVQSSFGYGMFCLVGIFFHYR